MGRGCHDVGRQSGGTRLRRSELEAKLRAQCNPFLVNPLVCYFHSPDPEFSENVGIATHLTQLRSQSLQDIVNSSTSYTAYTCIRNSRDCYLFI